MTVRTYNLKDIILTFGGVIIEGGADGDKMSVAPTGDDWTMQKGSDGEVIRSFQNDFTGRVTINLLYGAPSNQYLSDIRKQDTLTGNGVKTLSIADTRGNSLFVADAAWIMKRPEVPFGKDAGTVTWELDCAQITIEPGLLFTNGPP